MMNQARTHLEFACRMYAKQYRAGRVFLHEHPDTAQSWKEPCIQKLMGMPGVRRSKLDMLLQFEIKRTKW